MSHQSYDVFMGSALSHLCSNFNYSLVGLEGMGVIAPLVSLFSFLSFIGRNSSFESTTRRLYPSRKYAGVTTDYYDDTALRFLFIT